jgi:hypothetical protein
MADRRQPVPAGWSRSPKLIPLTLFFTNPPKMAYTRLPLVSKASLISLSTISATTHKIMGELV